MNQPNLAAITPDELAIPPQSSGVNRTLIESFGQVQSRKYRLLGLTLRKLMPEVSQRCPIIQFQEFLEGQSLYDRGRLFGTYLISDAMIALQQIISDSSSARSEHELNRLHGFTNAYAFAHLCGSVEGTQFPVYFNEYGEARFSSHSRYLTSPSRSAHKAFLVRHNECVELHTEGREVNTFTLSSFLDKTSTYTLTTSPSDDVMIKANEHIANTDIQIAIDDPNLIQELMRVIRMNPAARNHEEADSQANVCFSAAREMKQSLDGAVQIINMVWPQAAADVCDFTKAFMPFNNAVLTSYSQPRLAGVTFLRFDQQEVHSLAENILHENAHQRLTILEQISPILLNDADDLYSSPWRVDARPMRGLIYGIHAFTIVCLFYNHGIRRGSPWAVSQESYLRGQVARLLQAKETILQHAKLTAWGERFLEGIIARIDTVAAEQN